MTFYIYRTPDVSKNTRVAGKRLRDPVTHDDTSFSSYKRSEQYTKQRKLEVSLFLLRILYCRIEDIEYFLRIFHHN